MENTLKQRIATLIKADEGYARLLPDGGCAAYADSRGIMTIGYGYNLEAHGYTRSLARVVRWTREQAEQAFDSCLELAIVGLTREFPDWTNLAPARQAVAVSAMYQLGAAKVREFGPTIKLIREHDYQGAAAHMEASAWGRQTPARVKRLAQMMRTGEWL